MTRRFSLRKSGLPRAQRFARWRGRGRICPALALIITMACARADQVEMQNGDRYAGEVLSMNADVLVLRNEQLGTVKLPRGKVAQIKMSQITVAEKSPGAAHTNTAARATIVAVTNAAAALPRPSTNANSIRQVREQFLADASPEAMAKFNELAGGLLSGKLTVGDIRAQAKSAADQLRTLKAELGDDAGLAVDSYLAILDSFLKDTKSSGDSVTNVPARSPKPKPELSQPAD